MRYIGNKGKILNRIDELLNKKGLLSKDTLTFFDAFAGTATVAHHYKNKYRLIANDNLYFSYIICEAKLNSKSNMFETLGFDPFEFFLNAETDDFYGFISQNFAPKYSKRMYFSDKNASYIDFIRTKINEWYVDEKITENEKYFLIASLIESISKIANVAGVYGAYLKEWDPRATKKMLYLPIDNKPYVENFAEIYNDDILNVISKASGDILYLDPPYTKNQYSVQYHLLETIALYDNPILRGKTGARDMKNCASDFSKNGKAQIAFDKLIANANFKHIILSYSSDGIMSKDFIESVLKRYGKKDTYEFIKFNYRRYTNNITKEKNNHYEYLFYIEKSNDIEYASPLNFIGGKHDMIGFLKENMPKEIDTFYDLFAGGFNVGINVNASKIVYNDINFKVKELLEYIAMVDIEEFFKYINLTINRLNLSKENKIAYMKLRDKYNSTKISSRDCRDLFLLIMYGFQQQIRFNNQLNYNNPVGQAGFNDKILEKLISYSRVSKSKKILYYSEDYEHFLNYLEDKDFVYIDPPYLITLGSYNDGKRGFNGWNEKEEIRLLNFLNKLNNKNIKFMLSNVLQHKDKTNNILLNWINQNNFQLINYKGKTRGNRLESIVINYEV
ncbi:MAG TPA: Dam family site-specific DNA-(adenine-N6)-methyltransferase [Clostridia bacterium]|nr:Dam family site-specific DNA-(adenine-N6)-methyltransferase [Clostridia bacterium]